MTKLLHILFWGLLGIAGCTGKTDPDDNTKTAGTAGALTWTLSEDGTLTIEGKGTMPDYNAIRDWYSPWAHNKSIVRVVIDEGVNRIGSQSFDGCVNLVSDDTG